MSLQDVLTRVSTATDIPSPLPSVQQKIDLVGESFTAIGGTPASQFMAHTRATAQLLQELSRIESQRPNDAISTAVNQTAKETFGIQADGFINLDIIKQPYGTIRPIEPEGIGSSNADTEVLSLVNPQELQREIDKRRILNHMIQGGAYHSRQMIDSVLTKLNLYSAETSRLAQQFYTDANLSFFLVPDNTVNLGSMPPAATSQINLHSTPASVTSRAPVIPLLLHETVNGILEIVSSHGLPNAENTATTAERNLATQIRKAVLHSADRTQYELWDRRFGIALWRNRFGETLTPQTLFDFQEYAMRPAEQILKEL